MRLTTNENGLYVDNNCIVPQSNDIITKLGQLEDLMEKYGINSAEELEILCKYAESVKEWMSIYKEKMYKIKDIEEELGIDLVILFKALADGIWYKEEGHSLHSYVCLNADKEWVICCWLTKYECVYCRLKDYGKTWALTKEELL